MRRSRLVPAILALAATAFAAPPAHAAPGNCVAVMPGKPACSVQSAGGAFEITCVFSTSHCVAEIDGYPYHVPSGYYGHGTVPYGTVLGVTVHGTAGVATITTTN